MGVLFGFFRIIALLSIIISATPLFSQELSENLLRGPYLQLGTPTSMIIRWRTSTPSTSEVRYGNDISNLNTVTTNNSLVIDHQIQLSDLEPYTKYYYAIYSDGQNLAGDESTYFATSPDSGAPGDYRVWVIGDGGNANDDSRAARDAYLNFTDTTYTNVWLLLGDNAYNSGTDIEHQVAMFENMLEPMLQITPAWSTFGNHEGYSSNSNTETGAYFDIWSLPTQGEAGGVPSGTEAYYSFDYGNIHFINLNSYDIDRSVDGEMAKWLENDLAHNNSIWKIAYFHHPLYSRGSHNSDYETNLIEMRENFLPILEHYGVDLTLTGHSHCYERSFYMQAHYGLSNEFTLNPSVYIKSPGSGRVDEEGAYKTTYPLADGAVHIVAGNFSTATWGSLDHPAMFTSQRLIGSVVLDFSTLFDSSATDTLQTYSMKASFLDKEEVLQDYFTIEKTREIETEEPDTTFFDPDTALPPPLPTPDFVDIFVAEKEGFVLDVFVSSDYKIIVTNLQGKKIFTRRSNKRKRYFVPMDKYAMGIYFVKITYFEETTNQSKAKTKTMIWKE